MRKLLRLVVLVLVAVWVWRKFFGQPSSEERAGISYADGSAVVLEPGSPGFDRLAAITRAAIRA